MEVGRKKFVSSVVQEVLIVTISERKFKGGGILQRQRQPSIIISKFFPEKQNQHLASMDLLWKLRKKFRKLYYETRVSETPAF